MDGLSRVSNNIANEDGGGIFVAGTSRFGTSDAALGSTSGSVLLEIVGNDAGRNGGGIYWSPNNFANNNGSTPNISGVINNVLIDGNTAGGLGGGVYVDSEELQIRESGCLAGGIASLGKDEYCNEISNNHADNGGCLLYTSPSPRDATLSRMPSSA